MTETFYEPKCKDIFHGFIGDKIIHHNYLGDLFLCMNLLLLFLVLGTGLVNCALAIKVFIIYIVLFLIRLILSSLTVCDANVNKKCRPYGSKDTYWYIISGHTLNALFVTYIIINSSAADIIKYASIILSLLVMIVQCLTKEHYSVDIVLTALIVHLSIKAYIEK